MYLGCDIYYFFMFAIFHDVLMYSNFLQTVQNMLNLLSVYVLYIACFLAQAVDILNKFNPALLPPHENCSLELKEIAYCLVPKEEVECFFQKALNYYRTSGYKYNNIFRQLCLFSTPVQNQSALQKLQCPVVSGNTVMCTNSESLDSDQEPVLTFNCTTIFVWQEGTQNFHDIEQLFYDDGVCNDLTLVQQIKSQSLDDILYVSERYIFPNGNFPDSPSKWIQIDLYKNGSNVSTNTALIILSMVLLMAFVLGSWKIWKHELRKFKLKLDGDKHLKSLEKVLSVSSEIFENQPEPMVETFYPLHEREKNITG